VGQTNRGNNEIISRAVLLSASAPYYYKIGLGGDSITSFQLAWHDATSAFSAVLFTSNHDSPTVPAVAAAAPDLTQWSSEAADLPITTVAAAAAGSKVYHVGNCGARWGLLQITPTANCILSIRLHGKE